VLIEGTRRGRRVVNAPNRPDRQDISRPFVANTAPPHIVEEMQMMKEWMECMMSALKGRVSNDLNDLVHQTDSPFTISVNSFPLPPKFRMPQVENYDGKRTRWIT